MGEEEKFNPEIIVPPNESESSKEFSLEAEDLSDENIPIEEEPGDIPDLDILRQPDQAPKIMHVDDSFIDGEGHASNIIELIGMVRKDTEFNAHLARGLVERINNQKEKRNKK